MSPAEDQVERIGKILAHAASVEEAEARAAYEIAGALLDDYLAAQRHEKIVAAAHEPLERAVLLERFQGALALANAEGCITPAGTRLLNILRESPPAPKRDYTSPAACKFFAWHNQNKTTIRQLIAQL